MKDTSIHSSARMGFTVKDTPSSKETLIRMIMKLISTVIIRALTIAMKGERRDPQQKHRRLVEVVHLAPEGQTVQP